MPPSLVLISPQTWRCAFRDLSIDRQCEALFVQSTHGLLFRQPFSCLLHVWRHPVGKGRLLDLVSSRINRFIVNCCQSIRIQLVAKSNKSGPKTSMNVGHFSVEPPAHKYIGRLPSRADGCKDVVSLGVAPPTPSNACTNDCLCETWNRSMSTLKHDAV